MVSHDGIKMNTDAYIEILHRIAELSTNQLSVVQAILEALDQVNADSPATAPWMLAYTPTPKAATALLHALLQATEVLPRVPLSRIELCTGARHNLRLLALSDSPAYAAYPPREAASNARTFIASNWRGLNLIEGLWLTLLHPAILDERALDLVGSTYSIECTPTIYQWDGKRYLSAIAPDSRDEMCRPVFIRRSLGIAVKALDNPRGLDHRLRGFIEKGTFRALF